MQRRQLVLLSLIALFIPFAAVTADDTVENPEYKKWAVWKQGAYVTLKGRNHFGEVATVVTTTQSLKKVAADKLIIEVTTITETNGQTIKAPPTEMEIMAREPKVPKEIRKQIEEQTKKFAAQQTKGKETMAINGTSLVCEWTRYQAEGNDSKLWTCGQVPGETVKTESVNGVLKSSMQLIDWKGEKK